MGFFAPARHVFWQKMKLVQKHSHKNLRLELRQKSMVFRLLASIAQRGDKVKWRHDNLSGATLQVQ